MHPAVPSVWTVMLALMAAHLAGMGAFLTIPVLAPLIARETGLPASLAGLHTALVYAGSLVSGSLAGALLHRFGGVRVCQAGLVILALGIGLAVLGHPAALAASAVVSGVGHAPVTPAGSHLLAGRVPQRRRSLVLSIKQCGVPAGSMLIAATAPAVSVWMGGWRWGVLAVSALSLVVAVALQPLRSVLDATERERRPATPGTASGAAAPSAGAGASIRAVLRDAAASLRLLRTERALRAVAVMSALYGVSQFCFSTFFVVWQAEALGTSLPEAGLRLALAQAAGVVGRIFWGWAADRLGAVRVLAGIGLGAAAAGAALMATGPGWPGVWVTLAGAVMGATAVGWSGVMLAEVARLAPAGRVGAATAATSFVFALTMLVAPPLFSVLVALTGRYAAGFGLCAATALAGVASLRGARPGGPPLKQP